MVSDLMKGKNGRKPKISMNTTFSDKKTMNNKGFEMGKQPQSPRVNKLDEIKKINDFGEDALEKSKMTFEKNFEIMIKKSLSAVRSKCADYNFYVKNNYNKLLI
jgi:hypothetical protein